MKLGLGTAGLGMAYGIANRTGQPGLAEVRRILDEAWQGGLDLLDTAPAYGEGQTTLGALLQPDQAFHIVTKTLPLRGRAPTAEAVAEVRSAFLASLAALGRERVDTLLVHHADDLAADREGRLAEMLQDLKAAGRVAKLGVSVYRCEQAEQALERLPLEVVQLPLSLLDQRPIASGGLQALHARGIEIHARSLFLQGLLFLPPAALPPFFAPLAGHLAAFEAWRAERGLGVAALALAFVQGRPEVARAIVGVETAAQLRTLIAAAASPLPALDLSAFAWPDEAHLEPPRWPKAGVPYAG